MQDYLNVEIVTSLRVMSYAHINHNDWCVHTISIDHYAYLRCDQSLKYFLYELPKDCQDLFEARVVENYPLVLETLKNGGIIYFDGLSTTSTYSQPPKEFYDTFPVLRRVAWHPAHMGTCPSKYDEVDKMIVHLNDVHRWTREQIADWLDEIENDYYDQRAVVNVDDEATA